MEQHIFLPSCDMIIHYLGTMIEVFLSPLRTFAREIIFFWVPILI